MATLFQLPKASPVSAGESLAGSKLYFYQAGTLTPITTYTTAALSVAHNHPVVADSNGLFAPIFLNEDTNATYRMQLYNSSDVLQYDIDNLVSDINPNKFGVYVGTVGGTANAITLTPSLPITAYAAGQSFRFVAASANTSTVTVAVSGLTTKAITKNGATALAEGDILSGAVCTITYDGTQFQLIEMVGHTYSTYTGTLTGCTTTPTVTVKYVQIGKLVTLHVPGVSATSNSTGCTLSGAPAALRPASASTARGVISEFYNNTALEYGAISCEMNISGALEFRRAGSLTGFTNSGTKGPSDFMFSYILNTA